MLQGGGGGGGSERCQKSYVLFEWPQRTKLSFHKIKFENGFHWVEVPFCS